VGNENQDNAAPTVAPQAPGTGPAGSAAAPVNLAAGAGAAGGGINLVGLRPKSAAAAGGGPPQKPEKGTPTRVGQSRALDSDRRVIAFILLAILAGVILVEVLGSGVLAVSCWFSETNGACPRGQAALGLLTTALGAIFTAMVGLVGSVVGFYFGSQKQT
jgi:hypothetical protein